MARQVNGHVGTFPTLAAVTIKFPPAEHAGCYCNIGTTTLYEKAWSDGIVWKIRDVELPASTETSGTLTIASAGAIVLMSGNCTINTGVFTQGRMIAFWNRTGGNLTLTQGSGFTLYLANNPTAGNRTLAANAVGALWFMSATEGIIKGSGIT
jgi:hypothetical protein